MNSPIKNEYSIREKFQLGWWLLKTKLLIPKARLIRFPFTILGCRLEAFRMNNDRHRRIVFGNNIQMNDYVHISAIEKVEIGSNVLMASHIYISDNSHGFYGGTAKDSSPWISPQERAYLVSPVKIGDNVWIGEGAIIMPGVEIGNGCVIGAHSIVNKSIPSCCMAVGAPVQVVKRWSPDTQRWEKCSSGN